MTTELDTDLVPEALDLIDSLGTNMTFTTYSNSPDPTTSTVTQTEDPVGGTVRKASPPMSFSLRYVDGGTVQLGDTYIYVAASGLTFTPAVGMQVTHGSDVWKCVDVQRMDSGDDTAAWKIHLRR